MARSTASFRSSSTHSPPTVATCHSELLSAKCRPIGDHHGESTATDDGAAGSLTGPPRSGATPFTAPVIPAPALISRRASVPSCGCARVDPGSAGLVPVRCGPVRSKNYAKDVLSGDWRRPREGRVPGGAAGAGRGAGGPAGGGGGAGVA